HRLPKNQKMLQVAELVCATYPLVLSFARDGRRPLRELRPPPKISVVVFPCLIRSTSSAPSHRSSSQTQSPPDTPRPRAALRPSLDHSSARARCASPSLSFRPPLSLAPHAANSQSRRRRHCELTPKTRRWPY